MRFIRSRVPSIEPAAAGHDLLIEYVDKDEKLVQERFDMVVLSVGLETSPETIGLARKLDVELTEGQFTQTATFEPVSTTRDGIPPFGNGSWPTGSSGSPASTQGLVTSSIVHRPSLGSHRPP